MGIRESIRKSPAFGGGVFALLIVVAAAIYFETGRSTPPAKGDKAFYSDDNGKTFFVDSSTRPDGFDHYGKPAYRASVFQCGDGTPFVGYLSRGERPSGTTAPRAAPARPTPLAAFENSNGRQVRPPGGDTWFKVTDAGYAQAMQIHCPNGGAGDFQPVTPQ